jgi:sec-independent protein translocase protein TatA
LPYGAASPVLGGERRGGFPDRTEADWIQMITSLASIIGGWEIILVLAVILLIFGPKKLPEFARGLGQSIKEFKKGAHGGDDKR